MEIVQICDFYVALVAWDDYFHLAEVLIYPSPRTAEMLLDCIWQLKHDTKST